MKTRFKGKSLASLAYPIHVKSIRWTAELNINWFEVVSTFIQPTFVYEASKIKVEGM